MWVALAEKAYVQLSEIVDLLLSESAISTINLSLADRACLALAKIKNAVAVTGDKSWAEIPGISVKVIR